MSFAILGPPKCDHFGGRGFSNLRNVGLVREFCIASGLI
jgi:hypothetical protein